MRSLRNLLDTFLDGRTMYTLVFQGLMGIALFAIVLAFLDFIPYSGIALLSSLILLCGVCYFSNRLIARIFSVATNNESSFITALILFFILLPATDLRGYGILIFAGLIATASKYLLVFKKKHIFNPAAIALVILGLCGIGSAIWWVATPMLLPLVAILGVLILRKMQAFTMFFSFCVFAVGTIILFSLAQDQTLGEILPAIVVSWPLVFFGVVMLTEPATTPQTRGQKIIYAICVGLLFGAQFEIGTLFSTPELALVIGNIYAFIVSPRYVSQLILQEKKEIARGTYEFIFSPHIQPVFLPGQYTEWMLPHKEVDSRGVRRYFTIASSPTESTLKLGVRVALEKSSSFKKALMNMKAGDVITASGIKGEFTLPNDSKLKCVFIAGGIGITPFRSMVQYLIDTHDTRAITLLYSNNTHEDIAYRELFDQAEERIGMKTMYIITDPVADISTVPHSARAIDEALVKEHVPDYMERMFYISGPRGMVTHFTHMLSSIGVPDKHIATDFFPGFN